MTTNGRHRGTPNVAASFSELTHDVIELTELQTQLFMLDIKKTSKRTRTCLILAVVGICLLLGTIPVALMAIAEVFVEFVQLPRSASLGIATGIGLVLCAIFLIAAYVMVRGGLVSLQRSRDEFNRNVAWLKSTLSSRRRSELARHS